MTMPEQDRVTLNRTYSEVIDRMDSLRGLVQVAMGAYPVETNPRHGTYLKCIDSALGEVAAMANLSVEKVEETPQSS